jgi:hypothetical protein
VLFGRKYSMGGHKLRYAGIAPRAVGCGKKPESCGKVVNFHNSLTK